MRIGLAAAILTMSSLASIGAQARNPGTWVDSIDTPAFELGASGSDADLVRVMLRAGSRITSEKPWAPPRSYGLLVRIDEDGEAVESLHSRVGGRHHGITAARDTAQGLVIVSRGSGRVLLDRSGGGA